MTDPGKKRLLKAAEREWEKAMKRCDAVSCRFYAAEAAWEKAAAAERAAYAAMEALRE